MMRLGIVLLLLTLASCSDSVEPVKVDKPQAEKPYKKNAVDAVGVAKGNKQVSPNGRPSY
jgi:hypothetical protein